MEEVKSPDNEDLQNLIGKALQEQKALLCLVFDETQISKEWEARILDVRNRKKLKNTTLCAKMNSKSSQAQLLNAVCPIQSIPAVVIVQNGQVVGNYQSGQASGKNFSERIRERYRMTEDEIDSAIAEIEGNPETEGLINLPTSSGRMRLPNNAYDKFRRFTNEYVAQGLNARQARRIQVSLLKSTRIDIVAEAVEGLSTDESSKTIGFQLPEDVVNRLLNSPPSIISDNILFLDTGDTEADDVISEFTLGENPEPPVSTATSAQQMDRNVVETTASGQTTTASAPASDGRSQNTVSSNDQNPLLLSRSQSPPQPPQRSPSAQPQTAPTSQASQRSEYMRQHREREAAAKAERERIKAQIRADRDARREAEATRKAGERQTELESLRKANSTTSNPQSSDVRIQVRTFDGSTIKTTFPKDATISKDIRPWVDANRESKEPYDLKLILTPLPNRNIEAGEEGQELSHLGIKGSATMVMVPVKGFVESYAGNSSGGLIGSAVSGGYGLVSGAAGMLYGGVRSLLGGSGNAASSTEVPPQQQQTASSAPRAGGGNASGNVKVRTLADQRIEDTNKRGHQLYNGNQLNFEPRKDEDEEGHKKD